MRKELDEENKNKKRKGKIDVIKEFYREKQRIM
jgi:hypothetical protein